MGLQWGFSAAGRWTGPLAAPICGEGGVCLAVPSGGWSPGLRSVAGELQLVARGATSVSEGQCRRRQRLDCVSTGGDEIDQKLEQILERDLEQVKRKSEVFFAEKKGA